MTKTQAIQHLHYIEEECKIVRESIESGSDDYLTATPFGVVEALCGASCMLDAVYAGPIVEEERA